MARKITRIISKESLQFIVLVTICISVPIGIALHNHGIAGLMPILSTGGLFTITMIIAT